MGALPVVKPSDFLPSPTALETVSYETLRSEALTALLALYPDYATSASKFDPGTIVIAAYAALRLRDRERIGWEKGLNLRS